MLAFVGLILGLGLSLTLAFMALCLLLVPVFPTIDRWAAKRLHRQSRLLANYDWCDPMQPGAVELLLRRNRRA
ncbi:hypothetical protein A11A3_02847 [Alcanivorax hongdengensis A-11-3]|uniref:Uncharacterized protein n=1 Tax=Alcanivorax hongdengensis A-11-3 TaxID=1177179 RepID=L0WHY7_9GAMM|nr:hypothetical protein [Alcanivorax hongdengensis]EKF75772.1 hypothetical protein A11A3_02847 [Alcanivorax hongdengensis A-11-3]